MFRIVIITLLLFCGCSAAKLSSNAATFYVVRHAEKETATSNITTDVPLSAAGKERAEAFKKILEGEVQLIFSTNTKRTTGTAQPLV